MRDNPYVTEKQAKADLFPIDKFFKSELLLTTNSVVCNSSGQVLLRLFKGIIPESLLRTLEESTNRMEPDLRYRHQTKDKRGDYISVKFGSYIERGGSGRIIISEDNTTFDFFITDNHKLWQFMSSVFATFAPKESSKVKKLPPEYRIFGNFSVGYLHFTPIYKQHRDKKDYRWCCSILFGNFVRADLDFPYLNTKLRGCRGDLAFFWSRIVFHTLSDIYTGSSV